MPADKLKRCLSSRESLIFFYKKWNLSLEASASIETAGLELTQTE